MSYIKSVTVWPKSIEMYPTMWYHDACATVTISDEDCCCCGDVEWSSSNDNVATVNRTSGAIYAITPGTARIYATATDGSGVRDYLTGERKSDGEVTTLEINGVNCLYFELLSGGFICLRPSGTEPKLKVYYSVKAKDKEHAEKALSELKEKFAEILQ